MFQWELVNGEEAEEGRAVLAERVATMMKTVQDGRMHQVLMDDLAIHMATKYNQN